MTLDPAFWQERLDILTVKYGIVGAALAIGKDATTVEAASGVLNVRTDQPVAPDSLFQIGSVTKVWTAVLVMQLVEEGLVALDEPVVSYLPSFRVADERLTTTVTVRQLLTHTSGIDGDLFIDTGRGDDAVPKYVEAMADLTEVVPQGRLMSYCNSGYVLLGHLVATLRGDTWERILHDRLLVPLGLSSAGTLPEEALLYGAATGHVLPPGSDEPIVTPQWGIFRSAGPAGLIHAPARDLIAFARFHLSGGLAPDSSRLLSAESVAAMQEPQVGCLNPWDLGTHWGLGWILGDWGGQRVYGHGGSTLGQNAYFNVLPDVGLSVALLVNGGRASGDLYHALASEIGEALVGPGVTPPARPTISAAVDLDPGRYVGIYERVGVRHEISATEDGLVMTTSSTSALPADEEPQRGRLLPSSETILLYDAIEPMSPAVFFDLDGEQYMHFGARTTRRTH